MAEHYPPKCISEAWPETELIKLRVNKSKIWPQFSTQSPLRHPVFKTEKHTRNLRHALAGLMIGLCTESDSLPNAHPSHILHGVKEV